MKTILILEDNARELERLVKIVSNMELELTIECASSLDEAYRITMETTIDLFLLDIILQPRYAGDVSGMRFADNIRSVDRYRFTPIIFTTSLEDPELYAFSDIRCYSYIEKPYDADQLCAVIRDALDMQGDSFPMQNIYYKSDGILYKMRKDEIIYIELSRKGRRLHTASGDCFLPYKSAKEILAELGSAQFIRCNRYTIVNKDYIDLVDAVNRYISLRNCDELLEIGTTYKKSVMRDMVYG